MLKQTLLILVILSLVVPVYSVYATTDNESGDSDEGSDETQEETTEEETDETETPSDELETPPPDTIEPVVPEPICEEGVMTEGCSIPIEPEPPIECTPPQYLNEEGTACLDPEPGDEVCVGLGCPGGPVDPEKGCNDGRDPVNGICPLPDPNPTPHPSPSPDPCKIKSGDAKKECHDDDRKKKVIKIIKDITIVKKVSSSSSGDNDNDEDIEQTIVAINYDEGAGINCVFFDDDEGTCETFDVTKDKGKEPLLAIIPFDS